MKTKSDRLQRLQKHWKSLSELLKICGVEKPNIKKVSLALYSLERSIRQDAIRWCNGNITNERFTALSIETERKVQELFNHNLKGFFVNGDPRGYQLKIHDDYFQEGGLYFNTGLHKDFGGYGILAPEFSTE